MRSHRIAVDIGVLVADVERSLEFYRDLLGLAVVAEVKTSLIGQGQMVQLQHGESLIKLVELEKSPPLQESSRIASVLGYRYVTLLVRDLNEVVKKFEEKGVPIVLPLTQLDNDTRILMAEDPEGNIVEIVQEPLSTDIPPSQLAH